MESLGNLRRAQQTNCLTAATNSCSNFTKLDTSFKLKPAGHHQLVVSTVALQCPNGIPVRHFSWDAAEWQVEAWLYNHCEISHSLKLRNAVQDVEQSNFGGFSMMVLVLAFCCLHILFGFPPMPTVSQTPDVWLPSCVESLLH